MHTRQIAFWLKQEVGAQIADEASACYPLESGGVLMGYWADSTNVVATAYIGPGPNADHRKNEFTPDDSWQTQRIADHYTASGRMDTYLGDWHSHPDAIDHRISWKDRITLWRIACHAPAHAPIPLMVITTGTPNKWSVSAWIGEPRFILSVPAWLQVSRASVRVS